MVGIWNWIKNNPNRAMFLVPILLVAGISISHVVTWYDIANPINWAIYLSIAIEVAAMTALVAATNKIKGGVWFMFGLVTLIQMIGNIFFSFKEIDSNGDLFKSWVELTGPLWEMVGSDPTDAIAMKRWLSFLEGGLLPIISLTSLHFFVKYETVNDTVNDGTKPIIETTETINDNIRVILEDIGDEGISEGVSETVNDEVVDKLTKLQGEHIRVKEEDTEDVPHPDSIENGPYETSKIVNDFKENETKKIWDRVRELREEGKLPTPSKEDLEDEPTALAFTPYNVEEEDDFSDLDNTLLDGLEEENIITLTEEDSKIFVEEVSKEPESPNEVLENALKKYKESKGIYESPIKNKKTNIKRID